MVVQSTPFASGSRSPAPADPEELLREYAAHLPPALQGLTLGVYVLDSTGRIRWLNDSAKAVVGDVTGRLITSVVDPELGSRAYQIFERRLAGEEHDDFSIDVVGLDGAEVRVEVSSVPLREGHRAIGMFGVVSIVDPDEVA